ncbi:hypothetical protein DEU36_2142 [Microbacterium sp. AG238]|nr:hypothetical protein DEU36_2142 [Microbacterium sp. AG238]
MIDKQRDDGFLSSISNATIVSYAHDPVVLDHDLEADYAAIESLASRAVTFPLSPSQLLVIGDGLPSQLPLNPMIAKKSTRWLVGSRVTLNLNYRLSSPRR